MLASDNIVASAVRRLNLDRSDDVDSDNGTLAGPTTRLQWCQQWLHSDAAARRRSSEPNTVRSGFCLKNGTGICFCSPWPHISLCCETVDVQLVHCLACLFTSLLSPIPVYTAGDRGTCVWSSLPTAVVQWHGDGFEVMTIESQLQLPSH